MTETSKLALLSGKVEIEGPRIGGRVRFSRDGYRLVETWDGCFGLPGAAQTSFCCAETGRRLLTFRSEESELGAPFQWSDPDLKQIVTCDPRSRPFVQEADTGELLWEADSPDTVHAASTFASFSPSGSFLFESNLEAAVVSLAEASVHWIERGQTLLRLHGGTDPSADMAPPWPYLSRETLWAGSGQNSRANYPPYGIKCDPVWSASGLVGAATVFWGTLPSGGSLLPGTCQSNGDHSPLWHFSTSPMAIVWKVLSQPLGSEIDSTACRANVGMYLPPYSLGVIDIQYTNDGSRFLLVRQDGSLSLHNSSTGECVRVASFWGQLECASLAPDGTRVVAFSKARGAFLISLESGETISRYTGLGSIGAGALSKCGRFFVLGFDDGHAWKIELSSGAVLSRLRSGLASIQNVRFVNDGQCLVVSGAGSSECIHFGNFGSIEQFDGEVLDVSVDGALACLYRHGVLSVLSTSSIEKIWSIEIEPCLAEFSLCGKILNCVRSSDSSMVSYCASSGKILAETIDRTKGVRNNSSLAQLEFQFRHEQCTDDLGRGAEDASGYFAYSLNIRLPGELVDYRIGSDGDFDGVATAVAFKPDLSSTLLSTVDEFHDEGPRALVYQIGSASRESKLLLDLQNPSVVTSDMSTSGHLVVTVDNRAEVRIWSTETGRVQGCLAAQWGGCATTGVFSEDGLYVITISEKGVRCGSGEAVLWDVRSGEVLAHRASEEAEWTGEGRLAQRIEAEQGSPRSFTMWIDVPEGDEVARNKDVSRLVKLREGQICLKDWSTGAELAMLSIVVQGRCLVVVSGDRSRLVTFHQGQLVFWDGASGELLAQRSIIGSDIPVLMYSQDGSFLALSDRQNLMILDGSTGADLFLLPVQVGTKDELEFSNDSRFLLATVAAQPPAVFDLSNGAIQTECMGHIDPVWNAELSPQEDCVLLTYQSGRAAIWGERTSGRRVKISSSFASVKSCCFSPDGTSVLAILNDGTAQTFDVNTGKSSFKICSLEGAIEAAVVLDKKGQVRTLAGNSIETWDANEEKLSTV